MYCTIMKEGNGKGVFMETVRNLGRFLLTTSLVMCVVCILWH